MGQSFIPAMVPRGVSQRAEDVIPRSIVDTAKTGSCLPGFRCVALPAEGHFVTVCAATMMTAATTDNAKDEKCLNEDNYYSDLHFIIVILYLYIEEGGFKEGLRKGPITVL